MVVLVVQEHNEDQEDVKLMISVSVLVDSYIYPSCSRVSLALNFDPQNEEEPV